MSEKKREERKYGMNKRKQNNAMRKIEQRRKQKKKNLHSAMSRGVAWQEGVAKKCLVHCLGVARGDTLRGRVTDFVS